MSHLRLGGGPALRFLVRLKLRGVIRKQARRLKTLSGLILTLVGAGLFALWFGSLILHWFLDPEPASSSEDMLPIVRLGALMITLLTLSSSLTHRGLFLPREEIERLFAAPVARGDLIRYRMLVNLGRGALGGVILGLVLMRHMPNPLFAFVGAFVALETLPLVGQTVAILSGAFERNAYRRIKLLRTLTLPLALAIGAGVVYLALGGEGDLGRSIRQLTGTGGIAEFAGHGVVSFLTSPFHAWALTITAPTVGQFLPWFGVSLLIWIVLYETAARLPIDYRELSLETSASVADRLRRLRRGGGGAAGGEVTRTAIGWKVPWLLGRGPAGAVAWRKTGAIMRKARGTLLVSVLVLAFVTFLSTVLMDDPHDDASRIGGTIMIVMLGMFYLAGGLRFDFRDELDRMESIKSWPLSSRRLFFAMLAPEVILVSALISIAVFGRALLFAQLDPFIFGVLPLVPLIVFAWVALDNAVFLLMPVRMVPGQEGALQNAGRGILLLFLRMVLLAIAALVAGGPAAVVWFLIDGAGAGPTTALMGSLATAWILLLAVDFAVVQLGSWTFRRFDLARDRG